MSLQRQSRAFNRFGKGKGSKAAQIKAGAPVLRITRTAYDGAGVPFEYTESVYRGDKYVFNVTLEK